MNSSSTVDPDTIKESRYSWVVVLVLVLVFVTAFLDRQILSLLVDPIRVDLNISDSQVGLLQGFAFALFYSFCILPAGWLCDRYNRRNLLIAGVFLWTLMTIACGLAETYTQLFLARMGVGIGEAVLSPVAYSIICDYFPRRRWPFAIGVYSIGGALGAGLAYIFGAGATSAAMSVGDTLAVPVFGELRSWQLPFIIVGVPGLAVVFLCFVIREPARALRTTVLEAPVKLCRFFGDRVRLSICYCLGIGLLNAISYANFSWIPTYFRRVHGWETSTTAIYLGVIMLVFGTAGTFSGGMVAMWLQRKYQDATLRLAMWINILLGPLCILAALVPNPWVSLLLYAPVTYIMTSFVSLGPTSIQLVSPPYLRGQVTAFGLLGVNILAISLGPSSVALLTDVVYRDDTMIAYSLATAGGGLAATSTLFLWLALPAYRRSLLAAKAWGGGI
ncbi:MAG: MFS transporter [Parahaliea sp.]